MKFLVTVVLALLLLSVESVVVKELGMAITRIDVTMVLVAFLALRAGLVEGAVSCFTVGYLLDLMSGQPTGLYTFLAVASFLLGRVVSHLVEVRTSLTFALFTMGGDAVHGLLATFFSWMVARDGSGVPELLKGLPLQVVLTGLAALALHPLLRRLERGQERQLGLLR